MIKFSASLMPLISFVAIAFIPGERFIFYSLNFIAGVYRRLRVFD